MDVILKEFANLVNLIILSTSFHSMWDGQVIVV